jgi:HK97 family phage major capsid protein
MNLAAIRARLEAIRAERTAMHTEAGDNAFTDEQTTRWDTLDTEESDLTAREAEAVEAEARATRVAEARAKWGNTQIAPVKNDPASVLNGPATRAQLVTAALRANEGRIAGAENQAHFETLLKRHGGDTQWARQIVGRSTDDYASAFSKVMTGQGMLLTNEERVAIAVGTNTQGGFLTPTHLDPTLILTNSGSSNAIRRISRVVTLGQGYDTWNGVTTAGVTASWDAELAEVSDDTPSFASVAIPVYSARSLVQASFEAFQDIPGLQSDVMMLFADARDRLEGAAHATGSGSGQPKGIVTAVDASASLDVVSTTAATIGEVDVHALYRAVPVRWRGNGTFVLNPTYNLAIKRLGSAVGSAFTGYLTAPTTDQILGRPVVESDDMPTTQNTTELNPEIIYGDFSNYVIVDKPGSTSVEFIPNMFNTSNNLPDARRAWFMWFRSGADASNLSAFRILQDKTSA